VNAKLLTEALHLSADVKYLSKGEISLLREAISGIPMQRAWEYWMARANCSGVT